MSEGLIPNCSTCLCQQREVLTKRSLPAAPLAKAASRSAQPRSRGFREARGCGKQKHSTDHQPGERAGGKPFTFSLFPFCQMKFFWGKKTPQQPTKRYAQTPPTNKQTNPTTKNPSTFEKRHGKKQNQNNNQRTKNNTHKNPNNKMCLNQNHSPNPYTFKSCTFSHFIVSLKRQQQTRRDMG